ncbi:unnamed protein product, partial [Allacma fusca]
QIWDSKLAEFLMMHSESSTSGRRVLEGKSPMIFMLKESMLVLSITSGYAGIRSIAQYPGYN